MNTRKTLIAGLALATVIVFSPLSDVQAATFVKPGAQPGAANLAHSVKMKRMRRMMDKMMGKMKRHRMAGHMRYRRGRHKGYRMSHASSKAGRCGEYMYYSRKMHHCMDARNK